jgi:hypothetical protein
MIFLDGRNQLPVPPHRLDFDPLSSGKGANGKSLSKTEDWQNHRRGERFATGWYRQIYMGFHRFSQANTSRLRRRRPCVTKSDQFDDHQP